MYLKSIEIQGFKSFAGKMTLKFNKGITGIVGPNGSGKSNVADAVRWVLGEQSARQLRSSKMEDVIFSGTETRKPLGFAYVAITFDNADHKLALDYDEVTVARRVYRSGESEYLLNGSRCRLREVQEIFFDTGIGKEGYSIIGQGQIDQILSGKPEERRELFDEAAGIVKYKKRRQAAQKNLDAERQNLERVNDILSELERQIGPLKRQEETARAYLRLRDALKVCDVNLFLQDVDRIREQQHTLEEKRQIVATDLEETTQAFDDTKKEYETLSGALDDYDTQIEAARTEVSDGRLERERLEGEIKVLNEQANSLSTVIDANVRRTAQIEAQIAEKKSDLDRYLEEKKNSDARIRDLEAELASAETAFQEMSDQEAGLRGAIDDEKAKMIGYLNEAAGIKAEIGSSDTMAEQLDIRGAELNQRLIALKSEEEEKTASVQTLDERLGDKMAEIRETQASQAELAQSYERLSSELDEARRRLDERQQAFHRVYSRYSALKNIHERYEGYSGSIRRVMEKKHDEPGIVGVVADIITVPKKYETAVEIALGGSIQNIVTDNEDTAKRMINYLKTNKFGRATFLPLSSVRGRGGQIAQQVLHEPGVIGPASELVEFDSAYQGLIDYLLARIVVVDQIDHALALAAKYQYSLRIVTLDGEVLSPGGSMAGGAYRHAENLLGRGRELGELRERIKKIKTDISKKNTSINALQDERAAVRRDLEDVQARLQALSLEENTIRMNLNQARQAAQERAGFYEELSAEAASLAQQAGEIREMRERLEASLSACDDQQKAAQTHSDQLEAQLESMREKTKEISEQVADIRLRVSSSGQDARFHMENIERVRGEIDRLNDEIALIRESSADDELQTAQKRETAEKYGAEVSRLDAQIKGLEVRLEGLISEREQLSAQHKTFFDKREALSERIGILDKENFRLTHQLERLDEQRTARSDYLWQEYELTYNAAQALRSDDVASMGTAAVRRRIGELKGEIKNLGNVNVNAIEEYQRVNERYTLLKAQRDDLVETEGKLSGVIASLETAMRSQFTERFREIQKHFDQVFRELFGGGHGSLELMEDEDVLYAGIRIIASPPGKKLQNMMQLSGGEKALTAIALLFAIQRLKPSPFCLLDEIEAALDDANVRRFAQYLNRLTKDTQFIIITHRRGTMNAADVLYGITMQEKGVSALVSVSLIDSKLED